MPILSGGEYERSQYAEEVPLDRGDALANTFDTVYGLNPFSSANRAGQLYDAERYGLNPDTPLNNFVGRTNVDLQPTKIDANAARQQLKDKGLDKHLTIPDEGTTQEKLNLLMQWKQEELHRQSLAARSPSGFWQGAAELGTGFVASALDPANALTAFVPVVPEARYAMMLKNTSGVLGRAAVRARVGAAEGVVGQAAVEPIVYYEAQREQADYTATDSFLNIAFGTILGGGLHMGVGAIGDALAKGKPAFRAEPQGETAARINELPPEARELSARAAVAQAAADRQVDVDGLVKAYEDSLRVTDPLHPSNVEGYKAKVREDVINEILTQRTEDFKPFTDKLLSDKEVAKLDKELQATQAKATELEQTFNARVEAYKAENKVSQEAARKAVTEADTKLKTELSAKETALKNAQAIQYNAKTRKDFLDQIAQGKLPKEVQARVDAEVAQRTSLKQDTSNAVRNALHTQPGPVEQMHAIAKSLAENKPSRIADPVAADAIAKEIAELKNTGKTVDDVNADITDINQSIKELETKLGEDGADLVKEADTHVAAVDEQIKKSEGFAKGLKAAVLCNLRRG